LETINPSAKGGSPPGNQFMSSWLEKDRAMLGFLFGFNSRIGRLHYFIGTIVLAVIMTAIAFAIVRYACQHTPGGVLPTEQDLMTWPVIVAGLLFMWVTFTLQAMRVRDIGWDPVCVIPAWIAIVIVDSAVASKVPAWSIGHDHHGTIIGALIDLALILALTFWPSGDPDNWTPTFGETGRKPYEPLRSSGGTSAPAARIAQATRADFGRRYF
jgi:uncharacterized membrane protein YhaH (DUF805 family)